MAAATDRTARRRRLLVGGAALLTLAVAAGVLFAPALRGDPFGACRATVVAGGGSQIGGPFTMTDETGASVTDKQVLAAPALVYFGYTFCPDVCPLHMARTADAVDLLEEQGHVVTPVFVSVDPDRDTPERLREWTDYLHPRMLGLTGTPQQIASMAKAYKVIYEVPADRSSPDYTVAHMTFTYLMLPGHGFVELYSGDVEPEDMAEGVACFLDAA